MKINELQAGELLDLDVFAAEFVIETFPNRAEILHDKFAAMQQ